MKHLAYVAEGYFFFHNPYLDFPQEVIDTFYLNNDGLNAVNVIATKGKTIEEVRDLSEEDFKGMEPVKHTLDPHITYSVKKIEHMSKKEPVEELPFTVRFERGASRVHFDATQNALTIYTEYEAEEIYFYIPMPELFTEKVEL